MDDRILPEEPEGVYVGAFPGAAETVVAHCPACGEDPPSPVSLNLQADEFTYRGTCRRCLRVCIGSRTPGFTEPV